MVERRYPAAPIEGTHLRARFLRYLRRDIDTQPYEVLIVKCGKKKTTLVDNGDKYLRYRDDWDHEIQISVSPTGKSVQVYIDGEKAFP